MESVIVASLRGTFCALMLVGLAACGGGSDSDTAAPVAQLPLQQATPTTPPVTPTTPVTPAQPTPPTEQADANVAPQIAGSPATEVAVGQTFSFTPSASDADGDSLTFSISSKPSWASFDARTGRLSGTPGAADVGSHEDIAITVSDGEHTQALPQFAINVVQQSNGSATLAWQPPTQNTDGSALSSLRGYKIHYGTSPGNYDQTVTINNGGLTSYVIENLAPGTYFFALSAIAANGSESDLSHEASKTI